jgi:hypothetical protein
MFGEKTVRDQTTRGIGPHKSHNTKAPPWVTLIGNTKTLPGIGKTMN